VWFATHADVARYAKEKRSLMRIAVVADIHGNVRALRAVMEDLRQIRRTVSSISATRYRGPLEAAETADVLISGWRGPRSAAITTGSCSTVRSTRWALGPGGVQPN
jgi:hypothetical protein